MEGFTVTKGRRTPRKAQGQTRNVRVPALEGEGQGSARKADDRGKGHRVEQPLIVSDEEGSEDEEGNEEYIPLDSEDSEHVAAPNEAGTSASMEKLPPPSEDDDETKIKKLSLAFKKKKTVLCMWRDGTYHPANILEIKEQPPGCYQYYVHFTQYDRRNDTWLNLKQLKPDFTGFVGGIKGDTQTRSGVMTRRQKRQLGIMDDHNELDPETLREHEELTKVKKINKVRLGKYELETWYYSPLPSEYDDCEELFFCEFCLTFLKRESQLKRHMKKNCNLFFPPGRPIYCSGQLTVAEVDGTKNRIYGENLCYLAKMFLDHKSLLYDVGAFMFYILFEEDAIGFHIAAYFSKELSKMSAIHRDDILKTLRELDLVLYRNGEYIVHVKPNQIESLMDSKKKTVLKLELQKLKWPFSQKS